MNRSTDWPSTRHDLLLELRKGADVVEWTEFWKSYARPIHRLCARSGIPGSEADDVVQNVMVQLVKDLPALELDSRRGKFRSWLATVVIRMAIKYRTRLAKLPVPSGAVHDRPGTSDTGLDDREFRNLLDSSLLRIETQFTADELEAFSRAYFSNQPRREIATDLKRPISWVYRTIYKVTCSLETELSRIADDTILGIL